MKVIAVLAIVVLLCISTPANCYHDHGAHYHFDYSVHDPHTGDKKAQSETRNGKSLKGSYTFHEPDGTKRVVEYESHPVYGFQALVKRLGHAEHPHNAESYVGATHWGHF